MSRILSANYERLSLTQSRQLDQAADCFEEAWVSGEQPRIEDYHTRVPQEVQAVLLRELLRIELEQRCRQGQCPTAEEYAARFPDQDSWVAAVLQEVAVRGSLAQPPARPGKSPALPSIPGYEVLGLLGQGGMGVVYQGRQRGLNRPVALKMILSGACAGETERVRFQTEAEAVARLHHANIVQIFEVGEHEGRPFLALEFVAGGNLAARLGGTPQPVHRAAQLLETLARAVHTAHQQGIIHRDLKPANVLLTPDGVPKITDFGLAKQLGSDSGQTGTGAILGTPSYMAPEQAAGAARQVGPAADVYALGAILYEALTGRAPFKGATVLDTLEQVRSQEPVPPRRLQPKLSRDLENICLKCLEKDPRRRYADAAALAEDLCAFRESRPIQARPVGAWEQLVKWANRRPAVASLLAALLGLALVASGLVTWQWRVAVTAGQEREVQRLAAEDKGREAESQRQRAERLLVRFSLDRGQTLCEQGDVARGMLWLAHTLDSAPPEATDLRRAVRSSLAAWSQRLHALHMLLPHPAPVQSATFRPDGKVILTLSGDNRARLWRTATGEAIGQPLEHHYLIFGVPLPCEILAASFSPDGQLAATGGADGLVRLWQSATGRPVGKPLHHDGPVRTLAFAPKGRLLATGGDDRCLRLWETSTGQLVHQTEHKGAILALAYSPDGKTLLTGSADGTARLWQVATLRPTVTLRRPRNERWTEVRSVYFSPDGRTLLTVGVDLTPDRRKKGEPAVQLWEAATGRHIADLPHRYGVRVVVFGPEGRQVLTGGEDQTAQLWDAGTGEPMGPPLLHQDTVQAAAFSPDGKTLLTGSVDRTARVWEVATGKPIGQPLEHQGAVRTVSFSPDGRTALTASRDQTARTWTLAPPRLYEREFQCEGEVMAVAWSPDGSQFLAGTDRGKAWRWQVATGKCLKPALSHKDDVWVVAYSPEDAYKHAAMLTGSRDRSVRLWDAATAQQLYKIHYLYRVRCACFSPDGQFFLTGGGEKNVGEVRLWETASGAPLNPPLQEQEVVWQAAFSPDAKICAIASGDKTVRLWDLTRRTPLALPLHHQNRVVTLAFRPDGRTLATGSTDKTVRFWDVATGQPRGEPLHHPSTVWSLAFSADGHILATGCRDGAARLWDAVTGAPIGPPLWHASAVWTVACHPTEQALLTGSADEMIRLWRIPTPLPGDPKGILLWLQVQTAMELDKNGIIHWIDAERWRECRQQLETSSAHGTPQEKTKNTE